MYIYTSTDRASGFGPSLSSQSVRTQRHMDMYSLLCCKQIHMITFFFPEDITWDSYLPVSQPDRVVPVRVLLQCTSASITILKTNPCDFFFLSQGHDSWRDPATASSLKLAERKAGVHIYHLQKKNNNPKALAFYSLARSTPRPGLPSDMIFKIM